MLARTCCFWKRTDSCRPRCPLSSPFTAVAANGRRPRHFFSLPLFGNPCRTRSVTLAFQRCCTLGSVPGAWHADGRESGATTEANNQCLLMARDHWNIHAKESAPTPQNATTCTICCCRTWIGSNTGKCREKPFRYWRICCRAT
jgi:hypothetical protein